MFNTKINILTHKLSYDMLMVWSCNYFVNTVFFVVLNFNKVTKGLVKTFLPNNKRKGKYGRPPNVQGSMGNVKQQTVVRHSVGTQTVAYEHDSNKKVRHHSSMRRHSIACQEICSSTRPNNMDTLLWFIYDKKWICFQLQLVLFSIHLAVQFGWLQTKT